MFVFKISSYVKIQIQGAGLVVFLKLTVSIVYLFSYLAHETSIDFDINSVSVYRKCAEESQKKPPQARLVELLFINIYRKHQGSIQKILKL